MDAGYYFEDIHDEHQIAVHDQEAERYHFDIGGINHPVEFLGIFLGYATAPLFPETLIENYNTASLKGGRL